MSEQKQVKEVRGRTFKVRLSESEYQLLDSNNPYGSIAKLLRQSAIEKVENIFNSKVEEDQKIKITKTVDPLYSKAEREFILELSRIGNNVNQIGVVSGNGKYSTLRIFTPTSFNDIQHGIFA